MAGTTNPPHCFRVSGLIVPSWTQFYSITHSLTAVHLSTSTLLHSRSLSLINTLCSLSVLIATHPLADCIDKFCGSWHLFMNLQRWIDFLPVQSASCVRPTDDYAIAEMAHPNQGNGQALANLNGYKLRATPGLHPGFSNQTNKSPIYL